MGNKEVAVTKKICSELISINEGDQIPTMPYLAKKYSVGFGTVDKAINNLKASGIVELQSRGQMGTYLIKKDFRKLYTLSDTGPIVGQIPLPNAIEFEGIATGLTKFFSDIDLPFTLNFKNGALSRWESLLNKRCDFIVVSESSANHLKAFNDIEVVAKLSERTYYSNLHVIHRKGNGQRDNWLIGIDKNSFDNVFFSENEFPDNEKKDIPYYNFPYAIANGLIDAAIIHSRSFVAIDYIDKLEFKPLEYEEIICKASRAAFVALKENGIVLELFNSIIDLDKVEKIEKQVIDRKLVPSF